MAADEDHRQLDAARTHLVLHVQPAHPRHAHIQQHAGIGVRLAGFEKGAATGEGHAFQAHRLQQPERRIEHALVVIDHINQLLHPRAAPLVVMHFIARG